MKKRHFIKIWIVLAVVGIMSFCDWSFAAEDSEDLLKVVWELLYLVVSALSWIWVFFAKWAWELLTNEWVYGEAIWLDAILWQYRNVVKNMANFGLGFYFIYEVWKWVLSINGVEKIKDKLIRLLVAGVWIQASWFMTAVVVDVSTITLSAAWAFPSMVISQSSEIEDSFKISLGDTLEKWATLGDQISKGMRFSLFLPDMGQAKFTLLENNVPLDKPITKKELFDTLMPSAKSVSGPLYYLWFSILKTPTLVSPNSTSEQWWKSTIFNTLLQWWTTIIFAIEMLVLFIFAVMRTVYMRVFIVLSPIVLLLRCIEKAAGKDKWFMGDFTKSIKKHFNFTSFFWNAFKPTLIVLWFSLAMMFVSLMSSIIIRKGQDFDMWWVNTSNRRDSWGTQTWEWDYKYTTVIDGETAWIFIKEWGKDLFSFILCIITVVLVYIIIKSAANMWWWEDFVSKGIKKVQSKVGTWIGSMPLVPVSWWDKNGNPETHYISVGKTFWFGTMGNPRNEENLIESWIQSLQTTITQTTSNQTDALNSFLGWENNKRMKESAWNEIKTAGINMSWLYKLEAKRNAINKTPEGRWFMLDPTKWDMRWIEEFTQWLKDTPVNGIPSSFKWVSSINLESWKEMVARWKKEDNKNKSLQDMFQDGQIWLKAIKAYVEFFGLDNEIEDWLKLKEADISKSEEKSE